MPDTAFFFFVTNAVKIMRSILIQFHHNLQLDLFRCSFFAASQKTKWFMEFTSIIVYNLLAHVLIFTRIPKSSSLFCMCARVEHVTWLQDKVIVNICNLIIPTLYNNSSIQFARGNALFYFFEWKKSEINFARTTLAFGREKYETIQSRHTVANEKKNAFMWKSIWAIFNGIS